MLTVTCVIPRDVTRLAAGFRGRVTRKNDSADSASVSLMISKLRGILDTEGRKTTLTSEKPTKS